MENLEGDLAKALAQIRAVDTHEHLLAEEERVREPRDIFFLIQYLRTDLYSAGMTAQDIDRLRTPGLTVEQKWRLFEPYWPLVRQTGYGRQFERLATDFYGFPEGLTLKTARLISEALSSVRKGYYRQVLRDRCNLAVCLQCDLEVKHECLANIGRLDDIVTVHKLPDLRAVERQLDVTISSLDDLVRAVELSAERQVRAGAVGFKHGQAYQRRIEYRMPQRAAAERILERLFREIGPDWSASFGPGYHGTLPLQDYLFHAALRAAQHLAVPYQIHTGIQAGYENNIFNAAARHLLPLFAQYPRLKFDLFHISYPWWNELAVMAKSYANVHIDMCWAHVISPVAARNALDEFLDLVPLNKISAFGGDHHHVEKVYVHLQMARENIAAVLARRIREGRLRESAALEVARVILHDSPAALFKLGPGAEPAAGGKKRPRR